MIKRQVFFSFHYEDAQRASLVRNMGKIDGSSTFSDNTWEEVKEKTDEKIKDWIDSQLKMRSCLVVLVGEHTAERKWVEYEIKKAYEMKKGILGIFIHKLNDFENKQSKQGKNPFFNIFVSDGTRLSDHVICYNSAYSTSSYVYGDIQDKIDSLIEFAIKNAGTY